MPGTVAKDLINCGVSPHTQAKFAEELGIDCEAFWQFVEWHHNEATDETSYDQAVLSQSLESIVSHPEGANRERASAYRVLFETIVAINARRELGRGSSLEAELKSIQREMKALADQPEPDEATFVHFWDWDGKFHRALCKASALKSLEWVVDQVIKRGFEFGVPKNADEMSQTVAEHQQILDAIFAAELDEERIFAAFQSHVARAYRRWFPMDQSAYPKDLSKYPVELRSVALDVVREASQFDHLSENDRAQIFAKLQIQWDYPDRFVVYADDSEDIELEDAFSRRVVKGAYPLLADAVARLAALKHDGEPVTGIEFQPSLQE